MTQGSSLRVEQHVQKRSGAVRTGNRENGIALSSRKQQIELEKGTALPLGVDRRDDGVQQVTVGGESDLIAIGGLVTSSILTLVVLPVLYEWVEGRWERRGAEPLALSAASGGDVVR